MNWNLSKEDCAEIYHALGYAHMANLQARVGYQGEELAKGEYDLFKGDAQTIARCVREERDRVLGGSYDTYPGEVEQAGSISNKLAERLEKILIEIGSRGEKLNAAVRKNTA